MKQMEVEVEVEVEGYMTYAPCDDSAFGQMCLKSWLVVSGQVGSSGRGSEL